MDLGSLSLGLPDTMPTSVRTRAIGAPETAKPELVSNEVGRCCARILARRFAFFRIRRDCAYRWDRPFLATHRRVAILENRRRALWGHVPEVDILAAGEIRIDIGLKSPLVFQRYARHLRCQEVLQALACDELVVRRPQRAPGRTPQRASTSRLEKSARSSSGDSPGIE